MSNDVNIEETARKIYRQFNPNSSLKEVEERVWRLRCRNLSRGQIFSILSQEFTTGKDNKKQTSPALPSGSEESNWVTVESLPDKYERDSWR